MNLKNISLANSSETVNDLLTNLSKTEMFLLSEEQTDESFSNLQFLAGAYRVFGKIGIKMLVD